MKKYLIFMVFIFITFLSAGCQSESDKKREQYDKKQNNELNTNNDSNVDPNNDSGVDANNDSKELLFFDKTAILQKEDGWLYYLMIEKTINNELSYDFNGINMWKKISTKECFIPVYDEADNLVDRAEPAISALLLYEKSRNDVEKIYECLNTKTSIDEKREELKKLELSYIDINDVEKLLSDLDTMEYPTETGEYSHVPYADCFEEELDDNSKLFISYLTNFGYIIALNIEVSNSKGKVLSELAIENNLNSEQEKLLETFDLIEQEIIKSQSLDISKYEKDLDPKIYKIIKTNFKKLYKIPEESTK